MIAAASSEERAIHFTNARKWRNFAARTHAHPPDSVSSPAARYCLCCMKSDRIFPRQNTRTVLAAAQTPTDRRPAILLTISFNLPFRTGKSRRKEKKRDRSNYLLVMFVHQ